MDLRNDLKRAAARRGSRQTYESKEGQVASKASVKTVRDSVMTRKEWRGQADHYLHQILQLLQFYEEVAYIGQEPYKGDFFKVFAEGARHGLHDQVGSW